MFGQNMHTHLTEMMGYAAAALVLATFSVRHIVTLRCLAIASNLMFIAYAASAALPPVLILHALLLPLNALRLSQALQPPRHNGPQGGGESRRPRDASQPGGRQVDVGFRIDNSARMDKQTNLGRAAALHPALHRSRSWSNSAQSSKA